MPNQELQTAASSFFLKKPTPTLVSKALFDSYKFATEEKKQTQINTIFHKLAAAVNNLYYNIKDKQGNPYIYDCFIKPLQNGDFTYNVQRVNPATNIPLNDKSIFCYYSAANGSDFLYSDQLKTPQKARSLIESLNKMDVIQTGTPKELKNKAKEAYEVNRKVLEGTIKPNKVALLTNTLNRINFLYLEEMFQAIFTKESAKLAKPFLEGYKHQQLSKKTLDNINTPNKPYMDIISDIFKERQGVVIGESHYDTGALEDLTGNLAKLRSQEVKTFFIESPLSTKYVYEIFNKNGNIQSLQNNLNLILGPSAPSNSYSDDFKKILKLSYKVSGSAEDIVENYQTNKYKMYEEAQRLGINLVPMDNLQLVSADNSRLSGNYDDMMAYNILQNINNDKDKFIVLVGSAHTQLSNRLNIPMLEIVKDIKKDVRENALNQLKTRRKNDSTLNQEANIHITCDISDNNKDRTSSHDEQENPTKLTTSQEQNLEQIKAERDIFYNFIMKNHGKECLDDLLSQVKNKQPSKTPKAEEKTTLLTNKTIDGRNTS